MFFKLIMLYLLDHYYCQLSYVYVTQLEYLSYQAQGVLIPLQEILSNAQINQQGYLVGLKYPVGVFYFSFLHDVVVVKTPTTSNNTFHYYSTSLIKSSGNTT